MGTYLERSLPPMLTFGPRADDLTQGAERTQPNQQVVSRHSAPTQFRPDKGKGHLHPKATKSWLLHISPSRDRPHAPTKIYKDCRDRISELRPKPIPIPIDLDDPRVAHLTFEEWETYLPLPNLRNKSSPPDALPHVDPTMRFLFEKV
ncbi:unnamed protein product [Prunus brigantina]